MKKNNFEADILNSLAYGTLMRSQLPGDIDDYKVSIVKETYKDSSTVIKLKFVPYKPHAGSEFYINIDNVLQPKNAIILLRYSEKDGKATAKAGSRIKQKMILSVEKPDQKWQEVLDDGEDEEGEDSDIPKNRRIKFFDDVQNDSMGGDESELLLGYKGRKRKNNDDSDDD